MTKFALVLCAFGLMAMLTVWQHFRSVQAGYEVVKLRRERNILTEENRRLELVADRLESPEYLLKKVRELRLDLRPAWPDEVLQVKTGSVTD